MMLRSGAVVAGCLAVGIFVAPSVSANPPPPPPPPIATNPAVAVNPVPQPLPADVGQPPPELAPPGTEPPMGVDAPGPVEVVPVVSPRPSTMTTRDGWELTLGADDESHTPVRALTTAVSSREYLVSTTFTGLLAGPGTPEGILEVGYEIGCGIEIGATGIAVGTTAGLGTPAGLVFGNILAPVGGDIPVIGGNLGIGPSLGMAGVIPLRPGSINMIPVTKMPFTGSTPRVTVTDLRVGTDNCVGESFIRSYAYLTHSGEASEVVLTWYGTTTQI